IRANGLTKVKAEKNAEELGRHIVALGGNPSVTNPKVSPVVTGGLEVREAEYSVGDKKIDVTEKIRSMIRNGRLLVRVDRRTLGGLSDVGVRILSVRVRVNGSNRFFSSPEGRVIHVSERWTGAKA